MNNCFFTKKDGLTICGVSTKINQIQNVGDYLSDIKIRGSMMAVKVNAT